MYVCTLLEQCDEYACCCRRSKHTGNIRSHGVHEEVIMRILLPSEFLDNTVSKDKDGFVIIDGNMETNVPGIYALTEYRRMKAQVQAK